MPVSINEAVLPSSLNTLAFDVHSLSNSKEYLILIFWADCKAHNFSYGFEKTCTTRVFRNQQIFIQKQTDKLLIYGFKDVEH